MWVHGTIITPDSGEDFSTVENRYNTLGEGGRLVSKKHWGGIPEDGDGGAFTTEPRKPASSKSSGYKPYNSTMCLPFPRKRRRGGRQTQTI